MQSPKYCCTNLSSNSLIITLRFLCFLVEMKLLIQLCKVLVSVVSLLVQLSTISVLQFDVNHKKHHFSFFFIDNSRLSCVNLLLWKICTILVLNRKRSIWMRTTLFSVMFKAILTSRTLQGESRTLNLVFYINYIELART
jgi:hypothetical protein